MELFETHPLLTNAGFLKAVTESFGAFLNKGTSRSPEKLVPLHGAIAADIAARLGDGYTVWSKGYLAGKEANVQGRYVGKDVDVTIMRDGKPVAGIAVKFIMQNYSQNSNNYFENMLGETANIRSAGCPYFQVFIILDKLPYYKVGKIISKWETFSEHNVSKYVRLSHDNIDLFFHTPNKTLIYVVHLPEPPEGIHTQAAYLDYYRTHGYDMTISPHICDDFGPAVILNDYPSFIEKVYHTIKSL